MSTERCQNSVPALVQISMQCAGFCPFLILCFDVVVLPHSSLHFITGVCVPGIGAGTTSWKMSLEVLFLSSILMCRLSKCVTSQTCNGTEWHEFSIQMGIHHGTRCELLSRNFTHTDLLHLCSETNGTHVKQLMRYKAYVNMQCFGWGCRKLATSCNMLLACRKYGIGKAELQWKPF